ncbi:guanylate kinase [Jiulongibacter sediminis]|uniref:Guanylate kinase n=1 Tax=Jiulongibacter sediminis TaxID=1605367 RepID=A0A0P7BRL5_9BACT|nr:guanylate kinase [Jiulongibacter sediminis]KPM46966.1 guanylate kinase [Jiulongibacter sediminis]TBX22312.1 guanylate kinase [Jiulongibacter sediminis]
MGKAIIFSAPSGSGKTTIVKHLLANRDDLGFSISACTRDRRGRNEIDGKDYYFLSIEDFRRRIDEDQFVEWEEVYPGGYYGTLKSEVNRLWNEGKNVIFDVDVKGGLKLKKYFGDKALAIFVKVPSEEELEKRLRERGTETEDSLSKRLFKVKFEMTFKDQFDVILLNDNLEESLEKAEKLYDSFNNEELELKEKPTEV